jgi:hypothetical protein
MESCKKRMFFEKNGEKQFLIVVDRIIVSWEVVPENG